jgi:hypothetical protein
MNIFVLDNDPYQAAQYHCDKHVVKMILETAQLLCTAHRELDGDDNVDPDLYRKTHKNHPSAKWVRESNNNYNWTWCLLDGLCKEYTLRYGKTHLTETKLLNKLQQLPHNIHIGYKTTQPQCMPDEYKGDNTVDAYRKYYIGAKSNFAKWKNTPRPEWWLL